MYIFKNAVKNIGRNKGRNTLLAVIIFAIILTTAVSLIINSTTTVIIEEYKSRFGSEIALELDREKMPKDMNAIQTPTSEQYFKFGESDLLQRTEFSVRMMITPLDLKSLEERTTKHGNDTGFQMGGIEGSSSMLYPKATLVGNNRSDISEEFSKGIRKITQGNIFQNPNEVIVSEEYAKLNNLSIGDKIKIIANSKDNPMTHELTITGFYQGREYDEAVESYKTPLMNRNNEIIASIDTLRNMEMFNELAEVNAKYFLKEPSKLEAFQQELSAKGLSTHYKVTTDETGYKKVVGPVEGLAKITNMFMIVVLVLGSSIMIILSVLAIRERKYEIGVLRAMGMKKGKVALGLLAEMIMITAACLLIGLGIGAMISQPVADSLLQNQIEIANENPALMGPGGFGGFAFGQEELTSLSDLNVNISASAVGQIIMISFLLAGISSLAGIYFVTKYEPIKILSNRS